MFDLFSMFSLAASVGTKAMGWLSAAYKAKTVVEGVYAAHKGMLSDVGNAIEDIAAAKDDPSRLLNAISDAQKLVADYHQLVPVVASAVKAGTAATSEPDPAVPAAPPTDTPADQLNAAEAAQS